MLRACAEALGKIGRAALPAVPTLREVAKKPLARASAVRAIRLIEEDSPSAQYRRGARS